MEHHPPIKKEPNMDESQNNYTEWKKPEKNTYYKLQKIQTAYSGSKQISGCQESKKGRGVGMEDTKACEKSFGSD